MPEDRITAVEVSPRAEETVRPRVTPGTRVYQLAVLLTNILNPTWLLLPILILVTYSATGSWQEALKWAGLAATIVVLPLLALIYRRVRVGVYADSQVSVREQRHILYLVGAICTTVFCITVYTLDGPMQLKAMLMALFAAGLVAMGINYFLSKVSIHAGGIAGLAMVLVILFGRSALPAMLLVPMVAWSRVALGRHTIRQVVAGVVTAVTVTTVVLRAYGF
jgi:membrane-associated phospholipid phosphatase